MSPDNSCGDLGALKDRVRCDSLRLSSPDSTTSVVTSSVLGCVADKETAWGVPHSLWNEDSPFEGQNRSLQYTDVGSCGSLKGQKRRSSIIGPEYRTRFIRDLLN